MAEAFLKALKWYILVASAIIGTSAFMIAEKTNSVAPVIIGVLGYGIVYAVSHFWKELRGKILLISMVIFLIITFASRYIPTLMYILFNHNPMTYDPYITWFMSMAIIGIPTMTIIFKIFD